MSSVDERIVKMVFDNSEFSNKIGDTLKSLKQLNQSTDEIANNTNGLSALGKAFQQCEVFAEKSGFQIANVWNKVANIFEQQIASKIVNTSKQIANAMTFEGISDGFKEYELKMGSIQTIMAGTGESLQTVNKYLDELNTYSDKTIYSFADMTNNIGKFTNAGVKLEDAVAAIKGIANEAAISGANAQQASHAMYNFSQALSAGYVKLIDWKSIENAQMATKGFKDTLLQVAESVGTVEKGADGMYKVLGKNANGATMKETISSTKNFNDSLAYQWMTTEVLTKALKIYATDVRSLSKDEKDRFETELRQMGMNDEQIKQMEELGSKATDAASEIKTFTMLMDTLKEAIGSGWAMTWQLIIGDFEQAKSLWTEVGSVLSGVIDRQSQYRNDTLKLWQSVGGRTALIDALRNSFEGLQTIIKPLADGFRDVFRPINYRDLLTISEGIRDFTAKLKLSEETAQKVRKTVHGFFSVFDIGLQIVKGFLSAIKPMGSNVKTIASSLLDASASAGDFIYKLDTTLARTKFFEKMFKGIGETVKPVFDALTSGASGVLKFFADLFNKLKTSTGGITKTSDAFSSIGTNLTKGIDLIKAKLQSLNPFLKGVLEFGKGVGSVIGGVLKQIGAGLSAIGTSANPLGNLINLVTSIFAGNTLIKIFGDLKSIGSITEIFDSVGDTLKSFQKNLNAATLVQIATAIGIMAASLVVVASVDSNKLGTATAAISAMAFSLAGSMALLMKAVNEFSAKDFKSSFSIFGKNLFGTDVSKTIKMAATIKAVSKALVAMGAAVALMSVGLKMVSSAAEGGHLWESFAVVSLMLAELTGVALVLGKFGGKSTQGAKGLITLTSALVIMAQALKMVSDVVNGGGNYLDAIGIISLMLIELTGAALLIGNFGGGMTGMLGAIAFALSLNLLVVALKKVSDALGSEGQHIWQALGVIGLMAAGLAGVCVVLSKFAAFSLAGGLGAIAAAGSILLLTVALKQISDELGKADQHVWRSLAVIGVALLELAVGLTAMTATLPGAAALLVASAALIVLGGALKIIGDLSIAEIAKSLITLTLALTVLAVGLTLMIVALPGAAALVVAATGLTILAGALKIIGSMKLFEIVDALKAIAVALTGITLVTSVLSIASPFIIVFSAALLTFGAALVVAGAGMSLFANGLQALAMVVPLGAVALKELGTVILELIPVAVAALMDALGALATKLVQYAPQLKDAVVAVIAIVLQAFGESYVKFGEMVLTIITGVLTVLAEHTPDIAQAGANTIIAFLQAIADQIPKIVDQAYKCSIALIDGLATAIDKNNSKLIAAVDHLMGSILKAIGQWILEFSPFGAMIPDKLKDGINSNGSGIKDALKTMIDNGIEAIKKKVADFKKAGEFLIQGLLDAFGGTAVGKVVSAAAKLGDMVIGGLKSKKGLDEHSPSVRATEAGVMVGKGLINGLEDIAPDAEDAAAGLGDTVITNLMDPLSMSADDASKALSGFTDALSGMNGAAKENSDSYSKIASNMAKMATATVKSKNAVDEHTVSLDKNSKVVKESHGKYKLVEDQLKETLGQEKDLTKATDENTKSTENNTNAQNANAAASGKAGKSAKNHADVMEYASGVVDAFVKQYGYLYTQLGDDGPTTVATFAIKNLAEATYKASLKAKDAADQNKKTTASIEDMIKAFTEMKEKIYDSVKSMFEGDNFFQKFEVKTEMSMNTLLENMKSNLDGVKNWTNKLAELGTKGLDQGLLKQLAELGPKGYEYVNAFSTATAEQIQQANAMFAQAGTLPESSANTIVASYAQAGLNCVQGFVTGISENSLLASTQMANMGTTSLAELKKVLGIHSPSTETYNVGMFIVKGLQNGIDNNRWMAQIAVFNLCTKIKAIFEVNLQYNTFYNYGVNIGSGLAAGIEASSSLVEAAARHLSSIAASVTTSFNMIHSPSRLYKKYGGYIAEGFAEGMVDGTSDVQNGALELSKAIKKTLDQVAVIAENDLELHPVIEPTLDIANLRREAGLIGNLFPGRSIAIASSIGIGSRVPGGIMTTNSTGENAIQPTSINFTQNNYSPKPLSRFDIYRDTKNQLNMMKGVVRTGV